MTMPVTFLLVTFFVVLFLVASSKGQFDDLVTPAHRILEESDDENGKVDRT